MADAYTAADLLEGAPALRALTPPARLAIFGDPVAHSKSPLFQNAALRAAGIDTQYVKIHVRAEEAVSAFRALPDAGFLGANVTLPHKAAALAAVDEADDYAAKAGAVNTLLVEDNRLRGFNTDGPGFLRAVREEFHADVRDLRVMVLGAGGGAGRAIAVQCALAGCERLVLVNRTVEKAAALAAELEPKFPRATAIPHESETLRRELAHIDLVVNATAIGMNPGDPSPVPQDLLTPNLLIYDAVYAGKKTRLVAEAEKAGARAANGLSMLLHQGALAFEIWFSRPAPLDAMRAALLAA